MGSAYLNQGEEEKAVDLFLSAAGGVPQDTFLTEDLLNLADSPSGMGGSMLNYREYFAELATLALESHVAD